MANELQITAQIAYTNGLLKDGLPPVTFKISQALQEFFGPVITVPASDTALTLANLTTWGYIAIINIDLTNYVTYGPTAAGVLAPFGRIGPGEIAILRLEPGILWRWKANASPVKVQVKAWGN
jgi:hypothetical protein